MTSKEVMFSTWQAAVYIVRRGIPGDIVECGVWRGGSALLASLAVRENDTLQKRPGLFGRRPARRRTWLYDTFEGMTAPTAVDVDLAGTSASEYMGTYSDDGLWCYADEDDVRNVFSSEGFGSDDMRIVRGDVCETLRKTRPDQIAVLRLDMDWYASNKAELELLYPRVSHGGVAAGSAGEIAFGFTGVAAPKAASSSVAISSRVALLAASAADHSANSTLVQRLASALMSKASAPKVSPPTRPSAIQRAKISSNRCRKRSLSRNRPRRFFEKVEWSSTGSLGPSCPPSRSPQPSSSGFDRQ